MKADIQIGSLPANIDAERTILGSILMDNQALDEVRQSLKNADFSLDSHRRIAKAMGRLAQQDHAIDFVTLLNELNRKQEVEVVGGAAYLASLTEGLPRRPVIAEYVRIVKDKSLLRQLMVIFSEGIARASDQSETAAELVSDLRGRMEGLEDSVSPAKQSEVAQMIVEVMDERNRQYRERSSPSVPSGNAWFDHKMGGGYKQGKITLVAARPKVGKSSWALTSVAYNCLRGTPVSIFSMEMDRGEVIDNLVPYVVDLPNAVVCRPFSQTREQNTLHNTAAAEIGDWNLRIYDGPMDIDEMCWTIDRDTAKYGTELFVGDHLTLIDGPGSSPRERVNNISGRIRKKIKSKKAAYLMLCQLLKVSIKDINTPPLPGDIKESGNPAEDAHAVLMLHRNYDAEAKRFSATAELNLAYVRGGGGTPGSTTAKFDVRRLEFQAQAELDYKGSYYE